MSDGIVPLTPGQEQQQEKSAAHEGYLHRVIEEVDVLANVVAGGHQDETISSRLARDAEKHEPIGEAGSKVLDVFQADHGAKAQAADLYRAKEVEQLEENSGGLPKE